MNANAANFDPSRRARSTASNNYPTHQQAEALGGTYGVAAPSYEASSLSGDAAYYVPSGVGQYTGAVDYPQPQQQPQTFPGQLAPLDATSYQEDWSQQIPQVPSGYYFPTTPLTPQLYGAPVSALAYDDEHAVLYVASNTQPSSERRFGRRSSMLVTHSTLDGMLYSSCAGHPEAPISTLQAVYETFYGSGTSATAPSRTAAAAAAPLKIPPHAYRPPYGDDGAMFGAHSYHLGINTLLPFKGYVASVSPAAVRVHSMGGLCISDHDVEGMVCGTPHPNNPDGGIMSHISVGGLALQSNKSHLHCMDLYQGLRIVSSNTFRSESNNTTTMGVMDLATNFHKQTIVAACSDGTIRLLDGSWRKRGGSELAKIKSHAGGVTAVAVSDDGNLVCTTGFAARPSALASRNTPYAYPDQHLLIYDVRYLGRGGFVHPFAGIRGAPRFVSFLPDMEDQPRSRVLVASGQREGGMQIVVPFENSDENPANFLMPQLAPGESITSMHVAQERLAMGTSQSNVLQYELQGFDKSTTFQKRPLILPNYTPEVPALSIDPGVLQYSGNGQRNGATAKLRSIFGSYVLCSEPTVSEPSTFGRLFQSTLVPSSRRNISSTFSNAAVQQEGDFLATVPVSKLNIDLMENHQAPGKRKDNREPLRNPNKLLYARTISEMCYENDANQRKLFRGKSRREVHRNDGDADVAPDTGGIPSRYRNTVRPSYIMAPHFDHAKYNDTGLWPGWEYSTSMPNAYAVGVLVLLYFEPEVRSAMLAQQFDTRMLLAGDNVSSLTMELGFLFHQMESLARHAYVHPGNGVEPHLGPMIPGNFIASFATMPEADALALLDGAPAAVDTARRPEAFYRFLLHHLDKELSGKKTDARLIDPLHGLDFISVNEFVTGSGPPTVASNRVLTVDLTYDPSIKVTTGTSFGEVLRHALCKETRLRAWCQPTKSYETIVQRKIATSLPQILSLSCACAGRKEEEGLFAWRAPGAENGHWLPEMVEVELDDGNVIVRELQEKEGSAEKEWNAYQGKSKMPKKIAALVADEQRSEKKRRYRLEAVLSFVRDDMDPTAEKPGPADGSSGDAFGHHVLHVRDPSEYKRRILQSQQDEVDRLASAIEAGESNKWTLTSKINIDVVRKRSEVLAARLNGEQDNADDSWTLFNGFVVSKAVVEDARAFHVTFKEPCLVVYRAVESPENKSQDDEDLEQSRIPFSVMQTKSISTGDSPYAVLGSSEFPGKGDLVAFDAEFVSVQEEESFLTDAGSKVTLRETRHALARISVIDCRRETVLVDDHVLPHEPVADYLTRFSGIVEGDLDPKNSPHHLISTRSAYLKLRFLQERGCIFVGHGLRQDFLTLNLFVPPSQIIDTVEMFHKERMRYVSLRFLTNFVLKRDMQTEVHDSVEDARAAHELYMKARQYQSEGTFDSFLNDLYEYGQKTDWKLGVENFASAEKRG